MTPFQRRWREHASRLGLDVAVPFCVRLDGRELDVPVLLRQFGGRRGMLLVTRYETIRDHSERLVDMGYGFSCLSDAGPSTAEEDDTLLKLLRDWGWSGDGPPPGWLVGDAAS